jgi:hypothetical protein
MDNFIFIDNLIDYVRQEGFEPRMASKFQRVNAQDGKDYILNYVRQNGITDAETIEKLLTDGIPLTTIASDGTEETTNVVNAYKTVLNNIHNKDNKWSVDTTTFNRKYERAEENGVFKPKGTMIAYGPIRHNISFNTPWGSTENVMAGGFILQDPNNPNDIYGISREDWDNTYRFEDGR